MNGAQRRTWCKLAAAAVGLLIMGGALAMIKINDLQMIDVKDHTAFRLLGLLCAVPLILVVILDWGRKKVYDERDTQIERRSLILGGIAAFVFLGGAALAFAATRPLGSIMVASLPSLIYLAYFTSLLVSCTAALIQYGRESTGDLP
jgi:Sec-independent protein secretion pathway component TatC